MTPGTDDIRDIKGLLALWEGIPWWAMVLGAAVAGMIGFLLYVRTRRKRPEAVIPPSAPAPSAEDVAFSALAALGRESLDGPGQVKRFHFELSEITRRYVEARFGKPATDLTSEELCHELARIGWSSERADALLKTLRAADRVKFTDFDPGSAASRALLEDARGWIEAVRPRSGGPGEIGA